MPSGELRGTSTAETEAPALAVARIIESYLFNYRPLVSAAVSPHPNGHDSTAYIDVVMVGKNGLRQTFEITVTRR